MYDQGPVARSMVGAYHCLTRIKTLDSTNHASSNSDQEGKLKTTKTRKEKKKEKKKTRQNKTIIQKIKFKD